MINWLSNIIVKHFRYKAIAQINANPTEVAKLHFKGVIELLNRRYSSIANLYWIGSYAFTEDVPAYFKQQNTLTKKTLADLPFDRSTEDENIIDIFIGECNASNQWVIAFFSDNIELESRLNLMDTFFIDKDDGFNIREQEYLEIV